MTLVEEAAQELEALARANQEFSKLYPGERQSRQPIHTVYGGAQLYKAETTKKLGWLALKSLSSYATNAFEFARAVGFVPGERLEDTEYTRLHEAFQRDPRELAHERPGPWLAFTVYDRVIRKLESEAVEDFRIDFEDGFGARSDAEEDQTARQAANELARAMRDGLTPPFIGIRIKSFSEDWKRRGARTLELFLGELLAATDGVLPENFVVTLPKVTIAEHPNTLVRLFERLEQRHGLAPRSLRLELMIEVPQALLGPTGVSPLPGFLAACEGRCVGAHLGTYDFTAACNVTAAHQSMAHPLSDLARGMMQLAYAGTGIFLSDGATNVLPVGPHRGSELSREESAANRAAVHAAWRLSHRHIRRSLESGFYQGWDLHPAQLPVRYASAFSFFLEGLEQAATRLRSFVENAAQATLVGDVFDDAATGQGLLNYFLRALNSGALSLEDASESGLTPDEFALRSFAKILAARRARSTE